MGVGPRPAPARRARALAVDGQGRPGAAPVLRGNVCEFDSGDDGGGQDPRPARLTPDGLLIYVDYLEVAPWNLRIDGVQVPRYYGVGSVLVAAGAALSLSLGFAGRVGLHALPQAEAFYRERCRMTDLGTDPHYHDLRYFEYTEEQAAAWLAKNGMIL